MTREYLLLAAGIAGDGRCIRNSDVLRFRDANLDAPA